MKKTIAFLVFLLVLVSCNNSVVDKPDNLIAEDKMIDILSDVALLEAIKVENPVSLKERNIVPDQYIYKKYKIDSMQFSKSDRYYASDFKKYLKMNEQVMQRIEQKKTETDSLIAEGINVGVPRAKKEVIESKNKRVGFGKFLIK